jgi:hypothetical protein
MTIATSYTELIGGIQVRLAELGIRQVDFDKLAGFPEGLTGKAFGPSQVKRLGPEKLFDAIRAAGLRLRLEADPEQLERMQKAIAENCQPRQANQARMSNHASPVSTHMMGRVFKHFSRMGVKARFKKMSKKERIEHARNAANQRWSRHRKRVKAGMKASRTRKQRLKLQGDVPDTGPATA